METDYVALALQNDPEGEFCTFCNEKNDFADDIGWFHISPNIGRVERPKYHGPDQGYCCMSCWKGEPGSYHIARYGVGER